MFFASTHSHGWDLARAQHVRARASRDGPPAMVHMQHMHSHTSGGAATAAAALKTTGHCEGCQVGMGESYPQIWVVGDAQNISKSYHIKIRTKMIIYPSNMIDGFRS